MAINKSSKSLELLQVRSAPRVTASYGGSSCAFWAAEFEVASTGWLLKVRFFMDFYWTSTVQDYNCRSTGVPINTTPYAAQMAQSHQVRRRSFWGMTQWLAVTSSASLSWVLQDLQIDWVGCAHASSSGTHFAGTNDSRDVVQSPRWQARAQLISMSKKQVSTAWVFQGPLRCRPNSKPRCYWLHSA